jgi:hypothetical protein
MATDCAAITINLNCLWIAVCQNDPFERSIAALAAASMIRSKTGIRGRSIPENRASQICQMKLETQYFV